MSRHRHLHAAAGFTLLEVLVSTMIFSLVSLAMIAVFNSATNLFRSGESARAAADEATAVLGMIDDDLKLLVPPADGGFLYTRTKWTGSGDPGGNMALAFKIRNPDATAITDQGRNARLIVVYWVDDKGDLNRQTATAADSDGNNGTTSEYAVATAIYGNGNVVARGCLYFAIDLSLHGAVRQDTGWSGCLPLGSDIYSSEAIPAVPVTASPFPDALRVSLAITGGNRFSQEGRVVRDDGGTLRVTGVRQVPIGTGAMARIGDPGSDTAEWVAYDSFAGGLMNGLQRQQRRTTQGTHSPGEKVRFCPTFTLVRTFPH